MEIVTIIMAVLGIIAVYEPLCNWWSTVYEKHQWKKFSAQEKLYHIVITRYFRYYNRLNADDRKRFLFRTYMFHKSKKFHYVDVKETPEMPLLISAAAVQLTFGLEKFNLNYFRDIYVLKDDYHYGFYSRPFQGHVDSSGIYFSWDNFLKGIIGMTPNCNVGLHEMAHALAYVNFITQTEEDKRFKKEFRNFSKVARPIFQSMQQGSKNILGEYAATNYHEFWAVAVEVFFENPVRLRHELPALYDALSKTLNQDPIGGIVTKKIAA
ncbi:MAG TPA: zinc-dependent peptidase [Chitinophagaceae bacterium]|nr:zinc-dependent peptidase [Chitinophagaceae bacterium]